MQKPVPCLLLDEHFLPTASIKTLSTPMQNCWFTGWQWRKNSFRRIASLFKETDSMLLKSDFICFNCLGRKKDDSSSGMTVALFLGHNHKPSFQLLLWTYNGSLFPFWPVPVAPCTKKVSLVSGHPSADGHKFCSNLPQIFGSYVIMYYMMCLECRKHH